MSVRIEVAFAKMPKGGWGDSGDSLEMVERPLGGMSLVLADGQGSGKPARRISRMVAMKAVSLIADGSRDGAVARAVQDMLYTAREGKVSATLVVLTADLSSQTLVISQNTPSPVIVRQEGVVFRLTGDSSAIGSYRRTRPLVTELPLQSDSILVTFSDGILNAGRRYGKTLIWEDWDRYLNKLSVTDINLYVEGLLNHAVRLDQNRPNDDMSIMAMGVGGHNESPKRTLTASISC